MPSSPRHDYLTGPHDDEPDELPRIGPAGEAIGLYPSMVRYLEEQGVVAAKRGPSRRGHRHYPPSELYLGRAERARADERLLLVVDLRPTGSLLVPVYSVEGRYDELVPLAVAQAYYEVLDASHKEFVVFQHSAHSPPFEEPEAFCTFMHRVLLETTWADAVPVEARPHPIVCPERTTQTTRARSDRTRSSVSNRRISRSVAGWKSGSHLKEPIPRPASR